MKQTRRKFLKGTCAAGVALAGSRGVLGNVTEGGGLAERSERASEWRNRVDSMSYRRLGQTGLMVSEIVMGAIGRNEVAVAREAIERGLNYLDTAQRYGGGKSEEAVGALISEGGMRDRVFVSTKISAYLPALDEAAKDVLKGLPSEKQQAIRKAAIERMERLGVGRMGYHFNYFRDHDVELPAGYLTNEVLRQQGHREGLTKTLVLRMEEALEGSLKRLGTDYVDVLHCPHGGRVPAELEQPAIQAFFEKAKKTGKARFSAVSIHSDVPQVLTRASELGCYDLAMAAYNVANQASMELALAKAVDSGMGLIAMKVARAINRPIGGEAVPQWRIDKLNTAISEEMRTEAKAYLWALQNPNLAAVISAMNSVEMVKENLALAGRKVELGAV